MEPNPPALSVIVPSLNGVQKLPRFLAALEKQTFTDFELIIVLDGSTDGSKALLAQSKTSFPVVVVEQANQGRAGARNTAAKYARAAILVSMDDDMRPEPDCLSYHFAFHQKNKGAILGGRPAGDPQSMQTDVQKFKLALESKWRTLLPDDLVPLTPENLSLAAANFSIEKSLFEALGGFDSRLQNGVDIDLAMRAYLAKVPIYFEPKCVAWHDDFITCRSYIERQRQYTAAYALLRALKPEVVAHFPHVRENSAPRWKKILFSFFAQKCWVNMIDNTSILRYLLPQKIRYYFYNRVVFGLSLYFPERPI